MNKLIPLLLLSSSLIAKVDFTVGGEGVGYYQTNNDGQENFFSKESSKGSVGLEVDINAKIDNGFELGYSGVFLGTLGLDGTVISRARQYARANEFNAYVNNEIYLSKSVNKTDIKLGRQKLSMVYSPLAFSEDWNVFENSFEALSLMNRDLENTTIMAAYIAKANRHKDLSGFDDLASSTNNIESGMYFVTVANKSFENIPIRASYYVLDDINALETGWALWLDVKVNDMPLKLAFQAGEINPSNELSRTNMFGLKASKVYDKFSLSLAYSLVSAGDFSFQNFGTNGDVPFYTQMVNNQNFIALDAETAVLKTVTKLGKGDFIVQYGVTEDNQSIRMNFLN